MDQQKRGGGAGGGGGGGGGGLGLGGEGGGGGEGASFGGGGGGTGIVSLSQFEASIEAAARHAYLDCLEATLPMLDVFYKQAGDDSSYNEAARIVSAQKALRTILAGFARPRYKADMSAGLDLMLQEWQREQTDICCQIQAAKDSAARQAAQLLDQEKAAFAGQDFALANQMKEAKEAAKRDGAKLQVRRTADEWLAACCCFIHAWITDQTGNNQSLQQQDGAARQVHTPSYAQNHQAGVILLGRYEASV
jgi:hypothetical protein